MNRDAQYQSLRHWLKLEVQAAQTLDDVLQRERSALRERQADRLTPLTAEKQEAVRRLEAIARQRDHLLQGYEVRPGRSGIEALLPQLAPDADDPIHGDWKDLQELAAGCQHQNRINGGIIELSRRHFQRALDLLNGSGGGDTDLYGPQGLAGKGNRSQALAVA